MRPILLAALLALASCAGLLHPGPQTSAAEALIAPQFDKVSADVGPLAAQIPGFVTLGTQIGSGLWPQAAATLFTAAPGIYAAGAPAIADTLTLINDLRAVLSAASAGKSLPAGTEDLNRAEAILRGPGGSAKSMPSNPGPAPANAPGVTTFTVDGREWTETRTAHAVLVERVLR